MWMPIIAFRGLEMAKKRGFCSIFLVGSEKFWVLKFSFLAFFEAKITKLDIPNHKLIVPDDYQQFLVPFEWYLALFHVSKAPSCRVNYVYFLAGQYLTTFMLSTGHILYLIQGINIDLTIHSEK